MLGSHRLSCRQGFFLRAVPLAALVLAMAGCATTARPAGEAIPDPSGLARTMEEETVLEGPARLHFTWNLREPDLRASGEGVARVQPPHHARLDLFDERLEPVSIAALVDHDLRVPMGYEDDLVPAPGLLWATLGVFRPGPAMSVAEGYSLESDDGGTVLEYDDRAGEGMRFVLSEAERVREAELLRDGRVVEEVELSGAVEGGFPREIRYRHREDTRELRIILDSVEHVEPFEDDIWDPRG